MKKSVLLFLAFVGLVAVGSGPQRAEALTVAQLTTQIRRAINDPTSSDNRVRYSDAVILDYINVAQREVVNATWLSEKTTTYDLVPNTTFYALPDDLISVIKVEFTDSQDGIIELRETSLRKLFTDNVQWRLQSGQPTEYYVSRANISSPSITTSNISYIPIADSASTGTVTVQYVNRVSDLVSDTDVPFDAKQSLVQYHQSLMYNVVAKIKLAEVKTAEAQLYFQLYNADIGMIRERIGMAPNYTPSMQTDGTHR